MGRDMVRDAARKIDGFPEETLLLLEHAILAHHGKREFGAPIVPQTLEALLVSFVDDLDAKMNIAARDRLQCDDRRRVHRQGLRPRQPPVLQGHPRANPRPTTTPHGLARARCTTGEASGRRDLGDLRAGRLQCGRSPADRPRSAGHRDRRIHTARDDIDDFDPQELVVRAGPGGARRLRQDRGRAGRDARRRTDRPRPPTPPPAAATEPATPAT